MSSWLCEEVEAVMAKMSMSELHKDGTAHLFRIFRLVIRIYDHALLALGNTRRASLEGESIVSAARGIGRVKILTSLLSFVAFFGRALRGCESTL